MFGGWLQMYGVIGMTWPALVTSVATLSLLVAAAVAVPTEPVPQPEPQPSAARVVPLRGDMATLEPGGAYALAPNLAGALGRDVATATDLEGAQAARDSLPATATPPVGTTLLWPAMDVTKGNLSLYLKPYTLRAVGRRIEVWVASGADAVSAGTAFPAGDCRNAVAGSTQVTDEQVGALIEQFDEVVYPVETQAFSTPRQRDGTAAPPGLTAAGLNFAGDGDNTVTLVDNVRDPNFYDFPKVSTFISGFYAPIYATLTDRNVMTIDAFDWLHRTGANPPDEPDPNLCESRVGRPRAYESVFAHEWQHILHGYADPAEPLWLNEGMSDLATSLAGYADPRRTIRQRGAQSHIFCFQGFGVVAGPSNPNPRSCGGPQNSLTSWGDERGANTVLADYGNAWSFLLFLRDRYGPQIVKALHNDRRRQGLDSVRAQLRRFAPGVSIAALLHDYQLTNLLDARASRPGAKVDGIPARRVRTASLDARLNLFHRAAYLQPGAAPNGADYVLLRAGGRPLPGRELRALSFRGAPTVAAGSQPAPPQALPLAGPTPAPESPVDNWHVSLVGLDPGDERVAVRRFDDAATLALDADALRAFASYPQVVAVVAHDDVDSSAGRRGYARYELWANDQLQPGG